jgi:hypothetical protein
MGQAPDVGAPEFQKDIDEAWKKAKEGQTPVNACAAIKGSVHGRVKYQKQQDFLDKAKRTIQVCEYELPLRYFEAYLDLVSEEKKSCQDFVSEFSTQMGAVKVRMDTFEDLEPKDTEPLILKALEERIQETCPFVGAFMLRGL